MAISFVCVKCNKRFHVRDDLAGKIGKCSNCGSPIRVPSSLSAEPPTAVTEFESEQEPDLGSTSADLHHVDAPGPGAIDLGIRAEPITSIQPERGSSPRLSASFPPPAPTVVDTPMGGYNPAFPQRVVIVNVDIPFGTLVRLLVKFSLASIPATLLVWGILLLILMGVGSLFTAIGWAGGAMFRAAAPTPTTINTPAPAPTVIEIDPEPADDAMPTVPSNRRIR